MITKTQLLVPAALAGLCCFLWSCQNDSQEPSAAERALNELQEKYDELVEDRFGDPVQWAADDIENIGDWDYRVEQLSFSSGEELASQLNEFGNEKWEVIWLERTPDGFLVVMKKPAVSYISRIPLSQLGKFIIPGSEGQE